MRYDFSFLQHSLNFSNIPKSSLAHTVIILCNVMVYCYMRTRKVKQVNFIGNEKSYIPNETLVNFIQEWLHLHKKKQALVLEGKELSEEDKKKIRKSDRMKVYVLDSIIYPSFTNLIYFFEAIASSRILSEAFEDEVAELLDPRKSKSAAKFSGSGERLSSMQFRRNNLSRLIIAMLSIHRDSSDNMKPTTDFRVGLMYQIQNIIGDMMDVLILKEFSFGQIWRSALDDYGRMMGWSALLAKSTEEHPEEYDRKIGFLPIQLSHNAGISEIEF